MKSGWLRATWRDPWKKGSAPEAHQPLAESLPFGIKVAPGALL